MEIRKSIISIILTAALLICSVTVPVYAEDIESGEMDVPKEEAVDTDMPIVDIEGTGDDKAVESVPPAEEVIPDSDGQAPVMESYGLDSENALQQRSGLSLSVTYPTPIKCGEETVFTLHASGGTGNYQYRIHSLLSSDLVSVYDVSWGNNSAFQTDNHWKFTFYASGTYYIRFTVKDGNSLYNTGLYEYKLEIQDPNYPSVKERVDTITNQCIQECGSQASDFDKALWLHDWLVDNATYDYTYSYCSAEGVLARGEGTCESYHRAYVMLLNKLGIQTGRITGNGHVWTAVKIDGKWCHVDTTWDGQAPKVNDYQHIYFGIDDKITSFVHPDHRAPVPGYEAGADSLENHYFIKTGKIKKWSDPLAEQIRKKIADGETDIQFSFSGSAFGGYFDYGNVIYHLVAYQLSKENWDGINIEFSVENAAYQVDGKLICSVRDLRDHLTIEKNAEESVITVRLSSGAVSSNATISIPVWGEADGQNDIVWYQGKKVAEGIYEAKVPISAHKETGKYFIHVYANENGKQVKVAQGETMIAGITADEVICNESKSSKEDGKYRIEVKNLSSPSAISNVQIPVWSDANGQDDIRWYAARKDGDVWYVDVELKNHKYDAGLYHAHAYATDSRGIVQCVGEMDFTAEKMAVNQLQIEKNAQESVLTVRLTNATVNTATISVPVWGEAGGQNDIVWYTGKKIGEGTYEATVPISAHKETGKYHIHVYVNQNGKQVGIAQGETTIAGITADEVVCNESQSSKKDGKYRIEVKNLSSPSTISNVQIPVWSDANGQDDIRWYTARKDGDVWYIDVELKNHRYDAGLYHAHTYVTDIRGIMQGVGTTSFMAEKMAVNQLQIEKNAQESVLTVRLTNATVNTATISVPVWGEAGGQNDIVWYTGRKIGEGTYEATVPISAHKETGKYHIHVYVNQNGKQVGIAQGETTITGITADEVVCNESKSSKKDGKYRIEVKNISSPSNISNVQIPVWSDENGQDDIRWYTARKDGDVWYIDVELKNHRYDAGLYHVHTYVTDIRGIMQGVGTTNFTAEKMAVNQLQIEKNAQESVLTVRLTNATVNTATISVPVWGEAGGQNDIVWYTGRKIGEGTYEATVPISAHKETGKYHIHVYVNQNGKQVGIAQGETTIAGITADEVICNESKSSKKDGKYRIEVKNVSSPSNLSNVQIPVWSDANGQDDIRWYTAKKDGDIWYIDIDIYNHKFDSGIYHAHVYATDIRGIMQGVGKAEFEVEQVVRNDLQISLDQEQRYMTIILKAATTNGTVLFPVWGKENGQNDVVWYTGTQIAPYTYKVVVDIARHKETGEYIIHSYSQTSGNLSFIKAGSVIVGGISNAKTEIAADRNTAAIEVRISDVTGPSDIKKVMIPT